MTKHTPGPLMVIKDRAPGSLEVGPVDGLMTAEIWRRGDKERELADATLYAAAPDLLEALEEMVSVAESQRWQNAEFYAACVAIAKAKGETKEAS